MFKWYVTRGYPLSELLQSTYAEKILLKEAYDDWLAIWESIDNNPKMKELQRQV